MANDTALAEYLKVIGELDARLSELKELVENHFNYEPDSINWGHVGSAKYLLEQLNSLPEF